MEKRKKLAIIILIVYFMFSIIGLFLIFPAFQNSIYDVFRYNEEAYLLLGCLFIFIILTAPIALLMMVFRTDNKDNKNGIDKDREYIEMQIHDLNERLSSTASKWTDTNHLLLETQNLYRKNNSNGIISPEKFLDGFGIDINNIELQAKQVFVIIPFSSMYIDTYEVIKKTCEDLKLNAVRSDDVYTSSSIMKHIIELIVSSRIIIAVVDGRNPNVMYELGIAHALNKPTIILDQGNQIKPFDIQGNQIVIYDDYDDLAKKLSDQLINIVVSIK